MSDRNIRVCDRCGKQFDKKLFPQIASKFVKVLKFGFGDYEYSEETLDFCNNCTNEFEKFMKMGGGK